MVPPVTDRPVQRTVKRSVGRSVGWDDRMDKVSVLSCPVCDPPIRIDVTNAALTHYTRVCLLYPAGTGDFMGGSVDGRRLDHWRTGIVDSRALSVCYDCLCLMALFRAVMSLVHHWAEWSVWTGIDAGYCRTIIWEERYLPLLHPPCVVDRLCGYSTKIKVLGFVFMLNRDRDISPRRCACMRGTSMGVLSTGRIPLMVIGCFTCGGGPVDCSHWPRVDCTVDFLPGEVWIGYIRQAPWDRSFTDAAPVTGSLIFSALFGGLNVYCTAGFTSCQTFCSTDCVLLAGFGLSVRRVSEYWTFGVELYVPWDAPEAVVDISSAGVVPLRSILNEIGLTGRRADAVCYKVEMSAVCEFWFRILAVWTRIFTMSLSSTWEMYQSHPFQFRTYRHLVSSGHLWSLVTWGGASGTWRRCVRRPSSISVRANRVVVCTVSYGLSAQCRGASCGRARHRTVWITFGGGGHDVP